MKFIIECEPNQQLINFWCKQFPKSLQESQTAITMDLTKQIHNHLSSLSDITNLNVYPDTK